MLVGGEGWKRGMNGWMMGVSGTLLTFCVVRVGLVGGGFAVDD